jgi:hypothetical protein
MTLLLAAVFGLVVGYALGWRSRYDQEKERKLLDEGSTDL